MSLHKAIAKITAKAKGLIPTDANGQHAPAQWQTWDNPVQTPVRGDRVVRLNVTPVGKSYSTGVIFTGHVGSYTMFVWTVTDEHGYVLAHGKSPRAKRAYRDGNAALRRFQ